MKKLLITVAAVMLATSAYATDLPKKKKAPADLYLLLLPRLLSQLHQQAQIA